MLPGIVLFYSVLALILPVVMIVIRQPSIMGAGGEALSNACENLALIAIGFGVLAQRR
jgi:hypothetical protein